MNQQKETKMQKFISTISVLVFVGLMAAMLWGKPSYAATATSLPTVASYTASSSNLYSNQYQSSTTTAINTGSVFSSTSINLTKYIDPKCLPQIAQTPIPAAGFLFAPLALALTRVKRKVKG